jgi:hypothetical protein
MSDSDKESVRDSDDLRKFLTKRIRELKKSRLYDEHSNDGIPKLDDLESKYKASSLSKVQAVRSIGYKRLEESIRARLNKTGIDFSFKKAFMQMFKKRGYMPTKASPEFLNDLRREALKLRK